jgi:hypothetical protein
MLNDALAFNESNKCVPISEIYADDDSLKTRDAIISQFQGLAQTLGYTHCEVREYEDSEGGPYMTIFGGLMNQDLEYYC